MFRESTPLRRETLNQTLEAMRTGGVRAQIPLIQRSVEASRAGQSTALRGLEGQISQAPGLGGTPFAARLQAMTRLAGEQQTAGIPTQIAGQMAGQAPNLSLQFPSISNQGLAASGNLSSQLKGQQLGFLSNTMNTAASMRNPKG